MLKSLSGPNLHTPLPCALTFGGVEPEDVLIGFGLIHGGSVFRFDDKSAKKVQLKRRFGEFITLYRVCFLHAKTRPQTSFSRNALD